MSSVITCLEALQTRLQSIAETSGKSYIAYDPEELVRIMKGSPAPAIGVVYEGMSGIAESGSTSRGLGGSAVFGLYLAVDATPISNSINQKTGALVLLSKMRLALADTKAPGGHFWRFTSENYVSQFPNKALWVQKWSTLLMVPS